jgi:hypothetical protein
MLPTTIDHCSAELAATSTGTAPGRCARLAFRGWRCRDDAQARPAHALPETRRRWIVELMGVPIEYSRREAAHRDYAVLLRWWESARPTCGHRGCRLDWQSSRPVFRRHDAASLAPSRRVEVLTVRRPRPSERRAAA